MKKLSIIISCLILSIFASCTFAEMRIVGLGNVISDPKRPFEGKIGLVSYGNSTGKQVIQVDLSNDEGENQVLSILFTGSDLPAGIALLNAVGKPLVIEFSDNIFTVEDVFTYNDDPSKSASVMQRHNLLKQSK